MTSSGQQQRVQVPIEVSNRHVHLSQNEVPTLFGADARLTLQRAISQTGQFAADQTVALVGPDGTIAGVRVVGPVRQATQVEVSRTDARRLGLDPPLRDSGDLAGSPGVVLRGPSGEVKLQDGVIVQRRHIHATPEDCQRYGLQAGQTVRVRVGGERGVVFDQVIIKVHPSFVWRLHLDTDEANAAGIVGGKTAEVLP